MRSNYMSNWSTFRRAYAPPHHPRCQTGLRSLQEASELACVSLMQNTLENSLERLPPPPRARAQGSQGHPENGGIAPQTLGGSLVKIT